MPASLQLDAGLLDERAQEFFKAEMAKYARLVKKAGIELQ